ncbi:cytoplasmic protein [Arthrobacter sp. B10-11]|uniref:cytoplasmic protein n=1 Tax=Arthrobacter sp. B10-11 TaxID=3081160 RepID=UPI0029555E3C|nr:cytoplasmic protein [Arthrobacter sp. B10-11]MDV8147021.1 cytoplasmic protein [Arthrobacter sp. B10-11]
MANDPVETNPESYRVAFENDRVRVLEYVDTPGHRTTEHNHPDSVMITLSAFRRRISSNGASVEVELPAGAARWLPAQHHSGENIGETDTHTFFVELKERGQRSDGESAEGEPAAAEPAEPLGPSES